MTVTHSLVDLLEQKYEKPKKPDPGMSTVSELSPTRNKNSKLRVQN